MWKLYYELFSKFRDEFINNRLKMPFRQNLALIFFVLAAIAFVVAILQTVWPGWWY